MVKLDQQIILTALQGISHAVKVLCHQEKFTARLQCVQCHAYIKLALLKLACDCQNSGGWQHNGTARRSPGQPATEQRHQYQRQRHQYQAPVRGCHDLIPVSADSDKKWRIRGFGTVLKRINLLGTGLVKAFLHAANPGFKRIKQPCARQRLAYSGRLFRADGQHNTKTVRNQQTTATWQGCVRSYDQRGERHGSKHNSTCFACAVHHGRCKDHGGFATGSPYKVAAICKSAASHDVQKILSVGHRYQRVVAQTVATYLSIHPNHAKVGIALYLGTQRVEITLANGAFCIQ